MAVRSANEGRSMEKIDLGPQGFLYPMPVTLVGVDLPEGPSFTTVAWVNRYRFKPPRLVAGLAKTRAADSGILEHAQFSVCIPSVDEVGITDWCGLKAAGSGVDKGAVFAVFRGSLEHAPMIAECPLCLECRVYKIVDLDTHHLFVADIVGTWTEERFLLPDGHPDIVQMRPFVLSMPDNRYWAIGSHVADAWSVGKSVPSD